MDLSMTKSKRLPQHRDQLEAGTNVFIWVIGETTITDITEKGQEKESTSLALH